MKETEISVEANFINLLFLFTIQKVAFGYTLCHQTISPSQHIFMLRYLILLYLMLQ